MAPPPSSATEPRVLLSGLAYVESPRWHENRLWFAHWGTQEIVAVDLDGNSEMVGQGPPGLGWSIDWLRDGRLLVTGPELMRQEPDGSMVRHADLSGVTEYRWNEIVVESRKHLFDRACLPACPAAPTAARVHVGGPIGAASRRSMRRGRAGADRF